MPEKIHEMNGRVSACRFTNSGQVPITCRPQSKDGKQVYPLFEVEPNSAVIARIEPGAIEVDIRSSVRKSGRFMKIESGFFIKGEFYPNPPIEE